MFQFTTTNVINTNVDLTTGKPLWSAQKANSTTDSNGDTVVASPVASFNVKRVNNFKQPNVVHIYKSVYTSPELDKVTFNFGDITPVPKNGDGFRLSIYIRLSQSCQSSYYSNDMVFKGKPFSVEFSYKTDWSTTLKKLKETIEKYAILVYEKPLLKVSVSGNYLTIETTDEYQRLYQVDIERFDPEAYHGMGDYIVEKSINDLQKVTDKATLTGTEPGYFVGREGFGTYQWLLHNLRIPTTMRTRIYAMNSDETPIPGAKYNEYVIHYCVNRGILGDNAVGDTVTSMTTHVFYVNQTVAPQFEAALLEIAPAEGIVATIKADKGMQAGSPADVASLPEADDDDTEVGG